MNHLKENIKQLPRMHNFLQQGIVIQLEILNDPRQMKHDSIRF